MLKSTVLGYSQAAVLKLNDQLKAEGQRPIDANDLVFLDWFIHWYAAGEAMEKIEQDGHTYGRLSRSKVREDLPILGLSSDRAVTDMFTRLVKSGLLERVTRSYQGQNGSNTYMRPTALTFEMKHEPADQVRKNVTGQVRKNVTAPPEPDTKICNSDTPTIKNTPNKRNTDFPFSDSTEESSEPVNPLLSVITGIQLSELSERDRDFMRNCKQRAQQSPYWKPTEKQRAWFDNIVKQAETEKEKKPDQHNCAVCESTWYGNGQTCQNCGAENVDDMTAEQAVYHLVESIGAPWFTKRVHLEAESRDWHLSTIDKLRNQGASEDFSAVEAWLSDPIKQEAIA